MDSATDRRHWEDVYASRRPDEVSWYEAEPEESLRLIAATGVELDEPVLDAGGGASSLAARLVALGHTDVTVADISREGLARGRELLGPDAGRVSWVEADLREHDFGRRFAIWHDRAVFHFMVGTDERASYLDTLRGSVAPGGHVIIACFAPSGPDRCSGLPVARHDAAGLSAELGESFALAESTERIHLTPGGTEQAFTLARFERSAASGPPARGVEALLARARARLRRLEPVEAHARSGSGALLIDIRPENQRRRDGKLPGAHVVPRNVLEWRLDPGSPHCDLELARRDCELIVVCDEGFQSSLVAATLRGFGLDATDVVGGVQAWIAAGLPIER